MIVLTTRDRFRLAGPGAVGQIAVVAHQAPSQPLMAIDTITRSGAVVLDRKVIAAWDSPELPVTPTRFPGPDWITSLRTALDNLSHMERT
jgi:hypothetical protein